jgi:hypothetical protein
MVGFGLLVDVGACGQDGFVGALVALLPHRWTPPANTADISP